MTDFAVALPTEREDDLTPFEAPTEPARAIPVDRADAPVSEVTERFLRAIVAKVPLERIEELHLFAPLRQGGTETGIAVIAARAVLVEASQGVESLSEEAPLVPPVIEGEVAEYEATDEEPPPLPIVRHTVYTARYRLVLKGPERGRWEADVVDEADAPLLTVETVVRGVQRRAGEETEILRYSERQIARALRIEWSVITDAPSA